MVKYDCIPTKLSNDTYILSYGHQFRILLYCTSALRS